MTQDEVLGYLRSTEDFSLGPMAAIRAQTEAIGDPSLPPPSQVAVLEWLQDSYELWAENFPIEQPLAAQIRKLLPCTGALIISDESFLVPGSHPMHQLFDTIHDSAIGWQAALGRAAQSLEQLISLAIEQTDNWFRLDNGSFADICQNIIAKAAKDAVVPTKK